MYLTDEVACRDADASIHALPKKWEGRSTLLRVKKCARQKKKEQCGNQANFFALEIDCNEM